MFNKQKIGKITAILWMFLFINLLLLVYFSNTSVVSNRNEYLYKNINDEEKVNDWITLDVNEQKNQAYKINILKLNELSIYISDNHTMNGVVEIELLDFNRTEVGSIVVDLSTIKNVINIEIPEKESFADSVYGINVINKSDTELRFIGVKDSNYNEEDINGSLNFQTKYSGTTTLYHINYILFLIVIIFLLTIAILVINYSFKEKSSYFILIEKVGSILIKKKLYFVFEIILFFIVLLSLMNTIYSYSYFSTFNMNIIIFTISGIIFIQYLFYFIIIFRKDLANLFVIIAIPITLSYMLFMIPNAVPDEFQHFCKAYELSNFDFSNSSLVSIPKQLPAVTKYNYLDYYNNLLTPTDYSNLVVSNLTTGYNFVAYLFSSTALFIGRITGLSVYIAILLGRFGNVIAYLFLGYHAIKKLPAFKIVFFCYLLSPMLIQEAASISADALINIVSIYTVSYFINLYFSKEEITRKDMIILLFAFCFLALLKYIYLPIFFMVFILISKLRKMDSKLWLIFAFGIILTACLYYVFNIVFVADKVVNSVDVNSYQYIMNVDVEKQINYVLSNPLNFLESIINSFSLNWNFYLVSLFISPLADLTISINEFIVYFYLILLIASVFVKEEKNKFTLFTKVLFFSIFALVLVLTFFALYVAWTTVGADIVLGIQGRYFIPVAILILILFAGKRKLIIANYEVKFAISLIFIHTLVVVEIINAFTYIHI